MPDTAYASPFEAATQTLGLSPQEQNLYMHHLTNLYGDGKVIQPSGKISTIQQAVVSGPGSLYYSIPTIWEGKSLTLPEAEQRAQQAGIHNFPAYATPEQADARYQDLHPYLEQDTTAWEETHR